jgi:hypothetical protein
MNGRPAAGQWEEHRVDLEELVLAYLSRPSAVSLPLAEPVSSSEPQ